MCHQVPSRVIPIGHDAVLDGVLERQDAPLVLCLIACVRVLLAHAHHHALVPGVPDDGGEHGAGCVVPGEAGLAHAGAIVDDQRGRSPLPWRSAAEQAAGRRLLLIY